MNKAVVMTGHRKCCVISQFKGTLNVEDFLTVIDSLVELEGKEHR